MRLQHTDFHPEEGEPDLHHHKEVSAILSSGDRIIVADIGIEPTSIVDPMELPPSKPYIQ